MTTELPHRYREAQFRRYETYINHVVESYPQATKCIPKLFNVSQITFIARLRDAMRSLWDNQWETTIDNIKFREIYVLLQVTERTDGTILIGTKDAVRSWIAQDKIPEVSYQQDTTFNLNTTQEKEFIMQLSHFRMLLPRRRLSGLSSEEVERFQQTYDIAIDKNADGSYTLL